mmetsp:Transcript_82943/g.231354  ORF Transcript_82943/g.231354 Transcript_82943/m.231354 type:complete len:886 (-) Transcript_82943:97-2754(-)
MNALTSYVSYISDYIPATVKDAAGLNPQISQDVRHITWLSIERVFWPPQESLRLLLVLGYSDGFQVWDLQDPTAASEVISRQDKPVTLVRLLPVPLVHGEASDGTKGALGVAQAPLMAYLHRGAPALVRLFSARAHNDVHLLRLTEPAKALQASRRYFAVGLARQVDLYDALDFQQLFSVQCHAAAASPTFALGQRWLAYNLPPQQVYVNAGAGGLLGGGARQLPSVMRDGLQYLGHVGQRTLDHVLMPSTHDAVEQQHAAQSAARCGIVAVRDAASRAVIAQFEDHTEAIELMAWDPSGLQLVTCAAQGHQVLVHRALLGAEQALMVHESEDGGLAVGSVVFQHLYTLLRGYTPAVISDVAVSDDGEFVAVSSAKGTTHIFRLPPLHSAALGHHLPETGAVRLTPTQPCASGPPSELGIGLSLGGGSAAPRAVHLSASTRVKLGSVLLREGLMPKCGFQTQMSPSASSRLSPSQPRDMYPRLCIATRAGSLALYALSAPAPLATSSRAPGAGVAGHSSGGGGGSGHPTGGSIGVGGHSAGGIVGGGCAATNGDNNEWQALLTREVHVCRPFRHFTERRLSPSDGQGRGGLERRRSAGSSMAASADAGSSSPVAAWRSPLDTGGLREQWELAGLAPSPEASPRPSPVLRPLASPTLGPRATGSWQQPWASPQLGPRRSLSPPAHAAHEEPADTQRWLSQVETSTHVPVEVPVWLCPQLSFHTYPSTSSADELNAALRTGAEIPGRARVAVKRPERPGEGVRYGAASALGEERLSQLFGGAIGAALDDAPATAPSVPSSGSAAARSTMANEDVCGGGGEMESQLGCQAATSPARRAVPVVAIAPAWGAIAEQRPLDEDDECGGPNLAQVDGIGTGLDDVEEDWLQA